jgi:hypothetical protein
MAPQLCVTQLNDLAPLESLLCYVQKWFVPYSKAHLELLLDSGGGGGSSTAVARSSSSSSSSNSSTDSKTTTTRNSDVEIHRAVKVRLSALEAELLRSQHSVEIPRITLEVHPVVAAYIKQQEAFAAAHQEGNTDNDNDGKLVVEDLPNYADDTLINELIAGANEWQRSMLRVTKLHRDLDQGSTIHEVNFWMSMEQAVHDIYEQFGSRGVQFTLKVLKAHKRFWITTDFAVYVVVSH